MRGQQLCEPAGSSSACFPCRRKWQQACCCESGWGWWVAVKAARSWRSSCSGECLGAPTCLPVLLHPVPPNWLCTPELVRSRRCTHCLCMPLPAFMPPSQQQRLPPKLGSPGDIIASVASRPRRRLRGRGSGYPAGAAAAALAAQAAAVRQPPRRSGPRRPQRTLGSGSTTGAAARPPAAPGPPPPLQRSRRSSSGSSSSQRAASSPVFSAMAEAATAAEAAVSSGRGSRRLSTGGTGRRQSTSTTRRPPSRWPSETPPACVLCLLLRPESMREHTRHGEADLIACALHEVV